jgi:hypothetical protein
MPHPILFSLPILPHAHGKKREKVYVTPSIIQGGLLYPKKNYKTGFSTLKLFKTGQITLKRF